MLMSLVVAGRLTCDPEIKETGKGIKHYVLVMYLAPHSKDKRVEPHKVKFKIRVPLEHFSWLADVKKGDPITVSLDRSTQWWGGQGIVVVSGWTKQVRLQTIKQKNTPKEAPPPEEDDESLLEGLDPDMEDFG